MTDEQRRKNLAVPTGRVDAVLDTDTFNEIDDQFVLSYMLRSPEKLQVRAIYAAPFFNHHSESPADGMEKSYAEILKLLDLLSEHTEVFKGSERYLPDEQTFVESPAARDLVRRAREYSPEHPLYVVAIAAITNIASALLIDPSIAENIVVVWLGGHARHFADTKEFNMVQDIAAARVVMGSGAPFVQLPCFGVVSEFRISEPELRAFFCGKGALADYLAESVLREVRSYCADPVWTRVIWDVTAVAWLLNDGDRFMASRTVKLRLPEYNGQYADREETAEMQYVYSISRDPLMRDLIRKLTQ